MIVSKKKRNIILISVIAAVVVILTASLLLVFLLKPNPANAVEVIATDHQIFVKAAINEEERTYKFKFECDGQVEEIPSTSNILEITDYLWSGQLELGKLYKVSVCQIEPSGVLAGDYGQATSFIPTLKLQSTNVIYDESTKIISWQEIKGADFYYVAYNDGLDVIKVRTDDTAFDTTLLKGGERNIFVTAASNNNYLLESNASNLINTVVIHNISEFTTAFIDVNYTVNILSPERVSGIVLNDGKEDHVITSFTIAPFEEGYRITFSAKLFAGEGKRLTVKPLADDFNIFNGNVTVVE